MATYTLTDGTRKTQLTISGDTTVVFPTKLDYFGVRSLDGANILVSKIKAPTILEDGVYSTDEGDGDVVVDDGVFTDTLYLKGTGTVVVYGGAKSNYLPFKVGGKGGGGSGGDNTHYKGTTTTAISNGSTTNPITIDGESYTAVFGDIVVYNYTEFVFDGTAWSEFGRPFDTAPTSGSANAVTSDGIKTALDTKQNIMQYATMPTITSSMLGKVVQYVGTSDSNYKQGWNYVAVSDGAAEPTYSWQALMDSVPTSGSNNPVTSGGIWARFNSINNYLISQGANATSVKLGNQGSSGASYTLNFGYSSNAAGLGGIALGEGTYAQQSTLACGKYNASFNGSRFVVGNGTSSSARSNIVEVNSTEMNVNGDIKCHNLVVPVGGYEETVLWTGDQSSAPSEIEISEAYTNFDALFFKARTTTTTSEDYIDAYILTSAYGIGEFFQIIGYADSGYRYVWYKFTDVTHLERGMIGDLYMRKIVGIKYPKLYVPPVSLNQAPVTLLTNQTEEPTDETR